MNQPPRSSRASIPADAPESKALLPGMAALAGYMLLLAGIVAAGVVGHRLPSLLLLVVALFAAAAVGLLRRFRWGWSLAAAANLLLTVYGAWLFLRAHQSPGAVMSFLNLLFFLYLIRPEVRARLR